MLVLKFHINCHRRPWNWSGGIAGLSQLAMSWWHERRTTTRLMESRHRSNNGEWRSSHSHKAGNQLQRVFHENHAIFVQSREVIFNGSCPLISWHVLGQSFSCTYTYVHLHPVYTTLLIFSFSVQLTTPLPQGPCSSCGSQFVWYFSQWVA